ACKRFVVAQGVRRALGDRASVGGFGCRSDIPQYLPETLPTPCLQMRVDQPRDGQHQNETCGDYRKQLQVARGSRSTVRGHVVRIERRSSVVRWVVAYGNRSTRWVFIHPGFEGCDLVWRILPNFR